MEVTSEEFNFSQWLADCLNTDLSINENFDCFASNIFESIDQFARLAKDHLFDYFSQLNKDTINRLRHSLSYEVLDFHGLESTHSLRTTNNHNQILEDLYTIIQLSSSTKEQILHYNLSKTYDIIKTDAIQKVDLKDLNQLYELLNVTLQKNHNLVVEKLKNSKIMINSQNKKINSLQDQNKVLAKELDKVRAALDAVNSTLKSKISFPTPPLFTMPSNTNYASAAASNITNHNSTTPSTRQKRPPTTTTESLASKKSTTTNRHAVTPNNNNNRQRTLMNFNSYDAQSKNVPINNTNNNAFIVAGEKQQQKKQRNLQNKQYNKSVGLGIRIEYDDFIELNVDKADRKSKSFKFSIGYLDKDVINKKQLWPKYTIVNRYKMSLTEWETVSANFKNKKAIISTNTNATANTATSSIVIN